MKNPVTFSAIPGLAALLLVACDSSTPEITFESSFPKPHQDLTAVLGKEFQIRNGRDTLRYRLSTGKKTALITAVGSGDTLFSGKISRFRGVYYFNEANNDGSYFIYAVKIQDNLIYGLNTLPEQNYLVAEQVRKGKHKNLVTFVAPDSSQIRLRADKKELKEIFTTVLPQITPDTLVTSHTGSASTRYTMSTRSNPDPEESAFLVSVYPNPVKDVVNLRLRDSHPVNYQLTDLQGKTILKGQGRGELFNINLQYLQSGIYALTITLTDHQREEREILKIVKQ